MVERFSCFWKSMEDWWSVFFACVSSSGPRRPGNFSVRKPLMMKPSREGHVTFEKCKVFDWLIDCLFVVKGMSQVFLCSGSSCLGGSLWCNCCCDEWSQLNPAVPLRSLSRKCPPSLQNVGTLVWDFAKGLLLCHVCPGNAGDLTPSSPFWYLWATNLPCHVAQSFWRSLQQNWGP